MFCVKKWNSLSLSDASAFTKTTYRLTIYAFLYRLTCVVEQESWGEFPIGTTTTSKRIPHHNQLYHPLSTHPSSSPSSPQSRIRYTEYHTVFYDSRNNDSNGKNRPDTLLKCVCGRSQENTPTQNTHKSGRPKRRETTKVVHFSAAHCRLDVRATATRFGLFCVSFIARCTATQQLSTLIPSNRCTHTHTQAERQIHTKHDHTLPNVRI